MHTEYKGLRHCVFFVHRHQSISLSIHYDTWVKTSGDTAAFSEWSYRIHVPNRPWPKMKLLKMYKYFSQCCKCKTCKILKRNSVFFCSCRPMYVYGELFVKHCSSCASVVFGDCTLSVGKFLPLFSGTNLHKEKDKMQHIKISMAHVIYTVCLYCASIVLFSAMCM